MRKIQMLGLITLMCSCGGMELDGELDDEMLGVQSEALTGTLVSGATPAAPPPAGVTQVAPNYGISNLFISGERTAGATLKVAFQVVCNEWFVLPQNVYWKITDGRNVLASGANGMKISSQVVNVEQTVSLSAGSHYICVHAEDATDYNGLEDRCEQVEVYRRVHLPPDFFDPDSGHVGGLLKIDDSQFRFGSPVSYWIPSWEMEDLGAKTVQFPFPPYTAAYGPASCSVVVNDIRTWNIEATIQGTAITVSMDFEEKDHEFSASCGINGVGFSTKGNLENLSAKATFILALGASGLEATVVSLSVEGDIVMGPAPTLVPSKAWAGLGDAISSKLRGMLNTYGLSALVQGKTGDILRDSLLSLPALSGATVKKVSAAADGGLNIDVL